MNMSASSSDEEARRSEDEVLPPQVVDYYRNYSQSRKLPEYFRGSTISRIEECLHRDKATDTDECLLRTVTESSVTEKEVGERGESPSNSSVASKSKLEWDNGADIGYDNVEIEQQKQQQGDGCEEIVCGSSVRKRIGVPMAESTPINRAEITLKYVETPVLRKKDNLKLKHKRSSSYEDLSSSRSEKTLKKWCSQQEIFDPERVLQTKNVPIKKVINLRRTKPTVIECISTKSKRDKNTQTTLPRNATTTAVQTEIIVGETPPQPQRVGVVYSQHSDMENPENKTESTTQTTTDSDGVCVSKCDSFEFLGNLKRTEAKTNLAESGGGDASGSSGGSAPIGEILAQKFSRDLIPDIDQTIGLIQKLANSKRYDESTKRYYLKKIVEKIVNNCYSDDSSEKERYLQGNKPWKPMVEKVELKTQTFVDEFVPETKKKSPFTLCQRPPPQQPKNMPSSSGDAPESSATDDWREQKTHSERIFDEHHKSSSSSDCIKTTDNLTSFAKKERQTQLTWINNEIQHLNRLKLLLEDKRRNTIASGVLKPHVEDFPRRKKSTTVYMITTEKSEESLSNKDAASSVYSGQTAETASLEPPIKTAKNCNCPTKPLPVDLKNARLVSNEVFTTNSANGRATTSVARYCFEIPLDSSNVILKSVNNVQIGTRGPCKCCAAQAGTCIKTDSASQSVLPHQIDTGVFATPASSNFEIQSNERYLSAKQSSLSQFPETSDKKLRTDEIKRLASTSQTHTCKSCGCSSPKQIVQVKCSCTQTGKGSLSRKDSRTIGCQCALKHQEHCKCKDCANQCNEIVDAPSEKTIEGSTLYLNASNHAQSKVKIISDTTQTKEKSSLKDAKHKNSTKRRTSKDSTGAKTKPATTSSASSTTTTLTSSSSSSSSEFRLCPCCRLNKVAQPSERSVSNNQPTPNYILCHPCYQQCEQTTKPGTRPYYTYPGHVCNCYTVLKTSALDQIRQTVKDLATIDVQEDYCKCVLSKSSKKNKDACELCNCKLQKVRKARRGIAYTLTIEGTPPKVESPKGAQNLPEIKIKVPDVRAHKHKKSKDKENEDEVKEAAKKRKNHVAAAPSMSLQEYLSMNNPGFVQSAEERRKCLLELAVMREERCDKYKQLLALTSSGGPQVEIVDNNNGYKEKKLFTTKEMKAITAKHYKKLPEVQQKMIDNKERQIKLANRLLADIFNKRVRECALKGKTNLSTSYSVINFA